MKKLLTLVMALVMVLSMAACAGGKKDNETAAPANAQSTETPTEKPTEAPTEKPIDPRLAAKLGKYENGTYTNEFLGIECKLDRAWRVVSAAELARLNGIAADTTTDKELAERIEKSDAVHAFYAMTTDSTTMIDICMENVGMISGITMTESQYVLYTIDEIPSVLESFGATEVKVTVTSVPFAGVRHTGMKVTARVNGRDFYATMVLIKTRSYMTSITVGSYGHDASEAVLSMFSGLKE